MITPADVKDILDTDLLDTRIEVFIASAEVLTSGIGLSVDTVEQITMWLTAHLIDARKGQVLKVKAGSVQAEFADVYSSRISSTSYGQIALSLDTTGTLEAADGRNINLIAIPQ